ncbi:unnamed protein product [Trichobilharzia regenti]|nr:unnamed protein product [Trichobilharzia regenti]
MMSKYNIEDYGDVSDFLVKLARRMGRMKKGGVPDIVMSARGLINDWIT